MMQLSTPATPQRPKMTTTTKKPTTKQQHIVDVKQDHPSLTTREIAAICDTGHSHVVQTLQRYGVNQQEVEDYRTHRSDVLAGLQHRLIKSVTDDDIKKAPLGSRVLAAAQLYDKERLETGKTTGNLAVVQFQMPAPDPVPDELKAVNINGKVEGAEGTAVEEATSS